MYGLHPASTVFAIESTKYPLIPKSQIFTSPLRFISMFEGFTSLKLIVVIIVKIIFNMNVKIIFTTCE